MNSFTEATSKTPLFLRAPAGIKLKDNEIALWSYAGCKRLEPSAKKKKKNEYSTGVSFKVQQIYVFSHPIKRVSVS
ncbi:hypothetical protein OnM2_038047 [Erysiphe neolycopersici]|uniref:Uncharacterized protein n=1 Tax=Erysiphe neolycopersici TaxID=212602 RepID=A0A420HWQ4_9PEZI|nr:hypothetical protein OnM2_038047 [Erysiphe neolycopersici]